MAKLNEEVLVVKVSTLLADNDDATELMSSENIAALKQVIEQLTDSRVLVEIEKA